MNNDLYVARRSGVVMNGRQRRTIRRGQTIARAGHPIVDEHPELWEPIKVHYDVPAEPSTTVDPDNQDDTETPPVAAQTPAQTETTGSEEIVQRPVEQATAAPGERREVAVPDADQELQRPPLSGPGSGAPVWRVYAAKLTNTPEESWAMMSREDIVTTLRSEGVLPGE